MVHGKVAVCLLVVLVIEVLGQSDYGSCVNTCKARYGNNGNTNSNSGGAPTFGTQKTGNRPLGSCTGTACKASQCTSYPCLIFEDNFNTLDTGVWDHEITAGGGGNSEFQYYDNSRTNSYVKDGKLFIKPTLTSDKYDENFVKYGTLDLWAKGCTNSQWDGCKRKGDPSKNWIVNPVISGRIRTHKSFSFKYGKVEVEAKLPSGDWIWPAIWLLPTEWKYGGWPLSGEIDMMESRGNRNLKQGSRSIGVDSFGSTLHWGAAAGLNGFQKTHAGTHAKSGTFGTGFHKYGMEWTDQHIKMYVDGQLIGTFDPGSKGFYYFGQFWSAPNI